MSWGARQFHPLRVAIRLFIALFVAALALGDFVFCVWLEGNASSAFARAKWLQRWARVQLRNFHIETEYCGEAPSYGVLASNHISYTDILVYAAAQPLVFVSKDDVRGWPLVGWLSRCAGTLFLRREKKSDVARLIGRFAPVVEQGAVIALFPEGRTSDGKQILPFHSPLFAPVVKNNWQATPAWIGYSLDDGCVEDDVSFWRDISFARHLLNLLSRRKIRALVLYGEPIQPGSDRKILAKELHARVSKLKAGART